MGLVDTARLPQYVLQVVVIQARLSVQQDMEHVDYRLQTVSLPADYLIWCVITTSDLR